MKNTTLTIHGVPYTVNEKQEAFLYNSSVCIGTWDSATQTLHLKDDWQTISQPFLDSYREQVRATSVAAMEKAYELQGVALTESKN